VLRFAHDAAGNGDEPSRTMNRRGNGGFREIEGQLEHSQPSESLNLANIDVNGSYFGSVANGSAFYRDVPAGHYHIAPMSYNRDLNQTRMSTSPPANSSTSKTSLRKVGTALAETVSATPFTPG